MEERGGDDQSSHVPPVASAALDPADPGRSCPTGHARRGTRGAAARLVRRRHIHAVEDVVQRRVRLRVGHLIAHRHARVRHHAATHGTAGSVSA